MMEFIGSFGFSPGTWLLIIMSVSFIGMNKTGLAGISLIAVPVFAAVFGGKASTGFVLPLLIAADAIAVFSFRKSICWKALYQIVPWTLAGLGIAIYVGEKVSDQIFKIFITAVIFIVLIIMVIREIRGGTEELKPRWFLYAVVGLVAGFASMIGNVAGPIIGVYFLSINLGRDEFIATRAWFFWIVNIIKIPFHLFVWKTIDLNTLGFDLLLLPALVIGALLGIFIVKKIADRPYRIFLICITAISAVFLII